MKAVTSKSLRAITRRSFFGGVFVASAALWTGDWHRMQILRSRHGWLLREDDFS
jgi:hypothetical protein